MPNVVGEHYQITIEKLREHMRRNPRDFERLGSAVPALCVRRRLTTRVCPNWLRSSSGGKSRTRRSPIERLFLAQAMTLGNWEDMLLVRAAYGDDALRATLEDAPPGMFDQRSWNYWHLVLGRSPVPPMPRRRL